MGKIESGRRNFSTLSGPLLLLFLLLGCDANATDDFVAQQPVLRLAVTTSTHDSGLLDVLIPVFEKEQSVRVDVIAVGTGAALKLGERADVDVVLVHARSAEDVFMAEQHGIRREDVMYNTFEILGPGDDPAGIQGLEPGLAFEKIATAQQRFISRGDDSGTHQRELQIWRDGSTDGRTTRPRWDGYLESGQGMGPSLVMADQMKAYILADRGTYLKLRDKVQLVPLITSSTSEILRNPYGILVVNPQKSPSINVHLANRLVDFMVSARTQCLIRDYRINGEPLFYPVHRVEGDDPVSDRTRS